MYLGLGRGRLPSTATVEAGVHSGSAPSASSLREGSKPKGRRRGDAGDAGDAGGAGDVCSTGDSNCGSAGAEGTSTCPGGGSSVGVARGSHASLAASGIPAAAAAVVDSCVLVLDGSCFRPRVLACAVLLRVVNGAQRTFCFCLDRGDSAQASADCSLCDFPSVCGMLPPSSVGHCCLVADADMKRAVDGVVQGLEGSPSVQAELEACLAWLDSIAHHLPAPAPLVAAWEAPEGEPSTLQTYHPGHLTFAKFVIESKQVRSKRWCGVDGCRCLPSVFF